MTWRAYSGRVTFLPLASDAKELARDLLDLLHRTAGGRAELRLLPAVRPFQHGPDFAAGDKLVVEAEATPLYDGYLYVHFVQHDGTILHLVPGPDRPNNAVKAGERVLIGNGPREYTIAPPYGTELLIVMSSPTPLFKSPRPQIEEAKGYLNELSRALEAIGKQAEASPVVSNFSFITAGPRKASK